MKALILTLLKLILAVGAAKLALALFFVPKPLPLSDSDHAASAPSDIPWRSPEDPVPNPYVGPYGAEPEETQADKLLKSKCQQIDSDNAKLAAADDTIEAQQSKINTLTASLDQAEHAALEVHDAKLESLKALVGRARYDDLVSAETAAEASGRKVLVMFTATWCGPCHAVENRALADPQVKQYIADHLVLALVDGDQYPQTAKQFRVAEYPTVFVYQPGAGSVPGFTPSPNPNDFLATLKKL